MKSQKNHRANAGSENRARRPLLERLESRTLLSGNASMGGGAGWLNGQATSTIHGDLAVSPALLAPLSLTASAGTSSTLVHLAWNPVFGASSYQVYRSTSNDISTAVIIVGGWTRAHFNDITAAPGIAYFYWVAAIDNSGPGPVSASAGGYAALPGPANFQASSGAFMDHVQLSWEAVANAAGYQVFRGTTTDPGGAVKIAFGIGGLAYTDSSAVPGQFYFYWVRARNPVGIGLFSNRASGYAAAFTLPVHVSGTHLVNSQLSTVVLRGVNIPSLGYRYVGENVMQSVQVAIQTWHVNLIRLQLSEDFWFGYNFSSTATDNGGASYHALVDQVVNFAFQNGAYVMLDLQSTDANVWGGGNGQHELPDDHSTLFWQSVASHFGNNPAVIYDPFNEPNNVDFNTWKNGGMITDNGITYHSPGMQSMVNTIRGFSSNLIAAEGTGFAGDLGAVLSGDALFDARGNLAYQVHIYPPSGTTTQAWDSIVSAVAAQYPVIIGEWGVDVAPASSLSPQGLVADNFVRSFLSWADQHQYSWSAWSFHPLTIPVLISDFNFTPTAYFGAYVLSELTNGPVNPIGPAPINPVGDHSATLSWGAVTGAGTYQIWRSTSNDVTSAQKIAGSIATTGYVDNTVTSGQAYFYWVRARSPSGFGAFFDPAVTYA